MAYLPSVYYFVTWFSNVMGQHKRHSELRMQQFGDVSAATFLE